MSEEPKWIRTKEAAGLLERSRAQVLFLAKAGTIRSEKRGNRRWHMRSDVLEVASDRERWMSIPAAAELVGCSRSAIRRAVHQGDIEQPSVSRRNPSLRWRFQRQAAQAAASVVEEQRVVRKRLSLPPPSPDGEVWLDRQTAALVLGLSAGHLHKLSQQGRVPAVRVGRRYWYRRDHMERIRAARGFRIVSDLVNAQGVTKR